MKSDLNLSVSFALLYFANRWNFLLKSLFRTAAVPAVLLAAFLCNESANAVPLFARQTQQNCVACHVGGQYPELTPYGRYFKLTGYTQGDNNAKTNEGIGLPIAMSVQAGVNSMANNKDSTGAEIDPRNDQFAPDQVSLYTGGRIADNLGLFAQLTCAFDRGNQSDCTLGMDNVDLRYADHISDKSKDIIWGVSLNNNPGLTDVFNAMPAWVYPYQASASGSGTAPPVQTAIEAQYGGGTAIGVTAYAYLNRNYYAEFGSYWAAQGPGSLLTYTNNPDSSNGTVPLLGANPYFRLAYTREWGPSNIMVGVFGLDSNVAPALYDGSNTSTYYKDRGVDAQYQYISDPHVVSTQFRYINENITDTAGNYSGPANLESYYAKAMYVYRAKYGAALSYQRVSGSADAYYQGGLGGGANYVGTSGLPNTTVWTPAIFWQPLQNVRITLYKTIFTEYLGGNDNYDGLGRNASDNNTTYLYAWMAF
jgi:hypothetical protein